MARMNLAPWRGELGTLRREMESLFDRFFRGWPMRAPTEEGLWAPSVDVSETAKEVIVKAELPGMDPKDIEVSVRGDVLTLCGEGKQRKWIPAKWMPPTKTVC